MNVLLILATIDQLTKINKTVPYIRLEKAIENNKEIIQSVMGKGNATTNEMITVKWLRVETERLIHQLTLELQCEFRMSVCNRTRICKLIFR